MRIVSTSSTFSAVIGKLKRKRYDNEFVLTAQGFKAPSGKYYHPGDLKIIKTYFLAQQDSRNAPQLFVIEAYDGLIGYNLDTYGIFSHAYEDLYEAFISRIPIEGRPEEEIF